MATRGDIWNRQPAEIDSGGESSLAAAGSGRQGCAGSPAREDARRRARMLGWLSVGLGLAQVVMPRRVARAIGVDDRFGTRTLLRAIGLREIASGAGILAEPQPAGWVWARVAGDALDLALLRKAMMAEDASRWRVALTTAAVAGITAADAICAARLDGGQRADGNAIRADAEVRAQAAITINAPLEQVFSVWEGFAGLPRFMGEFAAVEMTGDRTSRWTATLPGGVPVRWEIEITEVTSQNRIAWRTVTRSPLRAAGEVHFRRSPGDRGTEILFAARFHLPGGELGKKIAKPIADVVGTRIGNDLRRCKQLIEIGEIVHSDDSVVPGPNPAQPRPPAGAA